MIISKLLVYAGMCPGLEIHCRCVITVTHLDIGTGQFVVVAILSE